MAIHVKIEHISRYLFDRSVALSPHVIRLSPAPHTRTPVHHYHLRISPENHRIYWQFDPFGNKIARVVFDEPVSELVVDIGLVAEMTVINPFDFFVESYAEQYPFTYDALLAQELAPYLAPTESGPLLRKWLSKVSRRKTGIVDFLVQVNQMLQQDINYSIRLDPGIQPCDDTLSKALGSCRDTGWLLVQILRHLGLAARFVSGYLIQLTADEKALDGPSGTEKDFTDLHAWTEVYIPGAGWVGLDPTSGLFAGEGHIPLACTPDPVSAAPINGYTDECKVTFEYSNTVTRCHEDPRVTKPYSDTQWRNVQALGRAIDKELRDMDVRLTMGGEPTFVSIDDMESAQWNTAALGPHKRERAVVLLKKLHTRFAAGGLLHYGHGKWYPGEPLPRWALGCYWRPDGGVLWHDQKLFADEQKNYGFTSETAIQFGTALAQTLGVNKRYLIPGFENWLHYLWRESRQPHDVDSVAIAWAPQFRDDLSIALARGLHQPVGYALPLRWDAEGNRWQSGDWQFTESPMYLIPGGSPMGFRLPLDQVPWTGEEEYEINSGAANDTTLTDPPSRVKQTVQLPHTAICIEARDGRLYVFMPSITDFEHYIALINRIENTARALNVPIVVEGYEPPPSPLVKSLKVTPDPGVIEVNIHPASAWDDIEENTLALYEDARQSRLATEKFMLDGRHTGTGGGNHVTLGGAQLSDSPFLRRPDLLRSFITYWQHHPSLSYLFSGLFIGPTSQAPRVDEKSNRDLRELELSLKEIDGNENLEQVDRALRDFLADISGNTHRAEFCIDKLYPLDRPNGRFGLLEFRAFEMPPHARMSLAQMLLLRGLVARFWKTPYRQPLTQWSTMLHDRFMLPHFVWSDFSEVINELQTAGYPFDLEWYAAFHEFRFPVFGRVSYENVDLELRMALEPWLVLGEETGAHRQARSVDSAIERLQLKARHLDPQRFTVTCNGRTLPLHATGVDGEFVAGIRYKAWNAVFGLHPTVELHAPLIFDLFDKQLGRSVGGCVYHVTHPGGRSYEHFPINAYEAEARRISRFWSWGHTIGDQQPPAWVAALQSDQTRNFDTALSPRVSIGDPCPITLDLRQRASL